MLLNKLEEKDANSASDPWFKLLSIEHIQASHLEFPQERDFIVIDCPMLVIAAAHDGRLVLTVFTIR